MKRVNRYLCAKVQPGEIERGDILDKVAKAKIMSDAADIVRLAVARGLISYPANQTFKPDGSPEPMLHELKTKPGDWAKNTAMRAYLLNQNGLTVEQVALKIRCNQKKAKSLIEAGGPLYKAKVASEPRKWGNDATRDLRRATRPASHQKQRAKKATR